MEITNKNKEEIEKIKKYIEKSKKCYCSYYTLQMGLQATIKTSILWCEDEIEFLKSQYCQCGCCENVIPNNPKFDKKLQQLQTHLEWLKEQEKENGQ